MNLVNFDIVVYVTHSVNAINIRKDDNLVLNQHTITLYMSQSDKSVLKYILMVGIFA